jgi:hypothetical protein
VWLGKKLYPSVEIPLAAQDQEEGDRQDGHQRGDKPGSANDHISGGQEEVAGRLPQLAPNIIDLFAEPLEHPTQPVLLGETLKLFCRSLRSLRHGDNEIDQTLDLVDQHGQEDLHQKEQRHHQPQVGEHYGEAALDQSVASL